MSPTRPGAATRERSAQDDDLGASPDTGGTSPGAPRDPDDAVLVYHQQFSAGVTKYMVSAFACPVEDAEDIVQEAFMELWDALKQGETIRHPKGWVMSVARRRLIDRRRHATVAARALDALWRHRGASPFMEPHQPRDWIAAHATLQVALARMTSRERRLFCLQLYAQLDTADIAALEGMDPRRVCDTVARGLSKVRQAAGIATRPESRWARVATKILRAMDPS